MYMYQRQRGVAGNRYFLVPVVVMEGIAVVESCIFGLSVTIFMFWLFDAGHHLLAIVYGKWVLHRKPSSSTEPLPAVSILKPLTGVDCNLYSNLESFFHLDYPEYELLFCVDDDVNQPAIMVVNSLRLKYPNIASKIFIGAKNVGVNPKINNMMQGYQDAKYELVLISDSGVRMKENTLTDMAEHMKEEVGLVHQMPYVCDREGFAAVLEKVFFGTFQARMYLAADCLGVNCMTGMSCLFRKAVLNEAGGLESLGTYLAEDYYLAQLFQDKGWRIRISSQPAWQNAGNYSVKTFLARMQRWTKLRTALLPMTCFLEPLSQSMLVGVLVSFAVTVLFQWNSLVFFFVHTLLHFIMDYSLLRIVQNGPIPFSKFEFICGWLFRECTTFYVMLKAYLEPVIVWRTHTYYIKPGAIGEEIKIQSYV